MTWLLDLRWTLFGILVALLGAPLAPGVGYFEHLPGTEGIVWPLFARALAGETVRENGVRLVSGEVITYWECCRIRYIVNYM